MVHFPSPFWMLVGWMKSKLARRHARPDSEVYLVTNPAKGSELETIEVSEIPESVETADDFLHWIGRR